MASMSDTKATTTALTGDPKRVKEVRMGRISRRRWPGPGKRSVVVIGLFMASWLALRGTMLAQLSPPAVNAAQPSASLPSSQQPAAQLQTRAAALRLDAGDLLAITTFDTPELSGKFRVDSRGEVSLDRKSVVEGESEIDLV